MSHDHRTSAAAILIGAGAIGAFVGVGSVMTTSQGRTAAASVARDAAVATGWQRRRAPRAGDQWGGCNDARAAGTAPIYRGEPGYRAEMDGDGDGEACEPIRQ